MQIALAVVRLALGASASQPWFKTPNESDMPLTINVRGNTTASKTKKT